MATTAAYQIAVSIVADSTGFKAGSDEAETAIRTLADQIDTSADQMNLSLKSVDDGVTQTFGSSGTLANSADSVVNTSGRKLKAAGKQVGTDFATSLTGAISSGDIAGTVSGLFSSLAVVGGAAALGVGLGGALITGLVKGVQQSEKEFTESISELLSGLEGQWDKSVNALVGKLRDALTEQKVLEDLGGGDFSSGIAKAEQLANDLGTSFRTVVDILQGEANPQTRALLEKIAGTREQVRQLGSDLNGEVTQEMVRINNAGAELVDKWEEQNKRIQTGRHQIDLFKSAQDDVAAGASRTADAMERQAQAMQRVNDLLLTTINRTGVVASNTLNGIGTIF